MKWKHFILFLGSLKMGGGILWEWRLTFEMGFFFLCLSLLKFFSSYRFVFIFAHDVA